MTAVGLLCVAIQAAGLPRQDAPQDYLFTATARYLPQAWSAGQERFPRGAAIRIVSSAGTRDLVPGFFSSADPEVSFDGQRILFAARPRPHDPWQIWELSSIQASPRPVAAFPEDCIRPLYLPGGNIAYARKTAQGYQLEVLPLAGGRPLRLTYAPGNFLPCDILRDGRILYEFASELYTVYPDGSGVEAYRCDHGPQRHAGRQLPSRDIVFATGAGLARFTSALAAELPAFPAHGGEFAGPIAEWSPAVWLAAFRPELHAAFAIYRVVPGSGAPVKFLDRPGVQPVILAPRETPLLFPSGLHDWDGANLLCLNAYTARSPIPENTLRSVRLYSQDARGQAALLGESEIESDGSFFLHVPSEQPLRLELRDTRGHTVAAEHGFFWMRRGEQRVCVGCHAGPERAPENAVPQVLLRKDVPVRMTGGGI